ncbi:MAG: ABC transporter permease [Pseudolabrys sp.]|nr:ABC transporter permease [Pseudolabrys sp.]
MLEGQGRGPASGRATSESKTLVAVRTLRRALYTLSPWLATIGFFVIWEIGCRVLNVPAFILPTPSAAVAALIQYHDGIWLNASHTMITTLAGFALAVAFGIALGVVVGASPLLYRALNPLLIGFNSIPKVAMVPILVLWFGIGTVPAILTAFLVAFFPITVNIATGIATMEPELRDVLRSLGASKMDILLRVGLPRSMPYFFASLKIAITLAFVGAVISETVASNVGIGYLMMSASATFRVPLVFAALLVIAAMGIVMYAVAAFFENHFTGWATRGDINGAAR